MCLVLLLAAVFSLAASSLAFKNTGSAIIDSQPPVVSIPVRNIEFKAKFPVPETLTSKQTIRRLVCTFRYENVYRGLNIYLGYYNRENVFDRIAIQLDSGKYQRTATDHFNGMSATTEFYLVFSYPSNRRTIQPQTIIRNIKLTLDWEIDESGR